jgi:hypothetical protein
MNLFRKLLFLSVCCCIPTISQPLTLKRVIVASDANALYLDFWPLVAHAWERLTGLRPTLALIAEDDVFVDETCGDVIRFKPIPGVPDGFYAQHIRHLVPAYFEEDGCLISDIDMFPLSKDYFIESVRNAPEDAYVVYRDKAYTYERFPMCYSAAKGKVFKEMFKLKSLSHIPQIIEAWHKMDLGWNSDERLLHHYVTHWQDYATRCIKLGGGVEKRVDRTKWEYDPVKVKAGYYIDSHSLRPYLKYKTHIDRLLKCLPVDVFN